MIDAPATASDISLRSVCFYSSSPQTSLGRNGISLAQRLGITAIVRGFGIDILTCTAKGCFVSAPSNAYTCVKRTRDLRRYLAHAHLVYTRSLSGSTLLHAVAIVNDLYRSRLHVVLTRAISFTRLASHGFLKGLLLTLDVPLLTVRCPYTSIYHNLAKWLSPPTTALCASESP